MEFKLVYGEEHRGGCLKCCFGGQTASPCRHPEIEMFPGAPCSVTAEQLGLWGRDKASCYFVFKNTGVNVKPNALAQGREPHRGEASPGATGSTTPGNHGEKA